MAGNIKGITIEFRGDTTKLEKAISTVSKESRSLDTQLKQVNNALKFNPKNAELWAQKQDILTRKVKSTQEQLGLLKQKEQALKDAGVDEHSEEWQKVRREIITTESKLKHYNGELSKTAQQGSKLGIASQKLQSMGAACTKAGKALAPLSAAAAGLVASFAGAAVKAGQFADDINTLSKQTGISTKELQMYAATADLVDVSVETMAKSHQKLKRSMLTAKEGGDSLQYFEQLGIQVTDADGNLRDANDVFGETIKALGSMENETERDALAMQIFGKSASELNPLIEDSGATYEKVAKMMDEYGLQPLSEEDLATANEFKDSLDTMKLIFNQVVAIVGTKVAKALQPLMESLKGIAAKVAEVVANMDEKTLAIILGIASAVALLAPALMGIGAVLTMVGKAISTVTTIVGGLSKAMAFLAANPIVLIIAGIVALVAAFIYLWNTSEDFRKFWIALFTRIQTKVLSTVKAIKTFFVNLWTGIKAVWNGAVSFFTGLWNRIKGVFSGVKTWFGNLFAGAWAAIKEKFAGWAAFWSGLWQGVKDKFGTIGTSIAGAISSTLKAGLNGVISQIENVINGGIGLINGAISLANLLPGVNVGKLGRINLPRLAEGGVLRGAQTVIAGEAGPEAIIPLDRLFDEMHKMTEKMSGGNGGGVVVNVYGGNADAATIAAEVERRLIAAQKRRRLAWQ